MSTAEDIRIRQLENGYDTLRTACRRLEADNASLRSAAVVATRWAERFANEGPTADDATAQSIAAELATAIRALQEAVKS